MTGKNIVIQQSRLSVKEAIDQLVKILGEKGIIIYARIDQQKEAARAGITLPPTEFLLFGNPSAGGQLMAVQPAIALDLPLKIVAWENNERKTIIAYNNPEFYTERYEIDPQVVARLNLNAIVELVL